MRAIVAALLLGVIAYLLTGVTQVLPGERAVVRRFGRVVDKPGPGLWIGLPYGMERVERVPIDMIRRVRIGHEPDADVSDSAPAPGQLLTGDHNVVDVQAIVDYAIVDEDVEDYVMQRDRVDGLIARAAESVLAEWIASHKVDEVLIRGKAELPGLLSRRTTTFLEPYRLGIRIEGVSIPYLLPPKDVQSAFDDVTRAQTAIRTSEHQARQEAESRLREARAEADRIEKLTGAYVREQIVLARAEADNFEKRLKQYQELRRDNPHILSAIWWDEIGKLLIRMKDNGRIDLLDNHLGGDGLDITISPPLPRRK